MANKTLMAICAICKNEYPAQELEPDCAGRDVSGKLIAGRKNMLEQVPACCMMCEKCFGESEEFNRVEQQAIRQRQERGK